MNDYLKVHMNRFTETIGLLQPIVRPGMRIVDLGSYGSLVPALRDILGANAITLTEPLHQQNRKAKTASCKMPEMERGIRFTLTASTLKGRFRTRMGVSTSLSSPILEHLSRDPSQTMSEINRITKTGGYLLLSTPNCALGSIRPKDSPRRQPEHLSSLSTPALYRSSQP